MNSNEYRACEKDINATIDDFTFFCNFIDEKKPVLTKQRAALGKNDLFEINQLLHNKKNVSAPIYQQESYPVIDLIFNLSLLGKLYVKAADPKGNVNLTRTERKDEFDTLNIYEKYAFLLETFWTRYDLEEVMQWGMDANHIDQMIQTFAASSPGEELVKGAFSKKASYDALFSYLSVVVRYFSYFSFCSYLQIIEMEKKIARHDDSIKAVIPTEFGVNICKVLLDQNIADWNKPWLKQIFMKDEKDIVPGIPYQGRFGIMAEFANKAEQMKAEKIYKERERTGFIPLYKFLKDLFPEGTLNNTVTAATKKVVKCSYIFKVSLGRSVWRMISLSYKHTLEDLHNAVQEAFHFENDHLYSFFMDGKMYSKQAYHSPMSDGGPFVDEVTIGKLELYVGQKILYLFDYGDSWEFEVQVFKMNSDEIPPKAPKVIEIKGEAPKQYRYHEDDGDEYM